MLTTLAAYQPRRVDIDGCEYREGLSAVAIGGGVAGNVIPDAAHVDVNFRFAPDRSIDTALAHVREVFAEHLDSGLVTLELTDSAAGALPGLAHPAAAALVEAAAGRFRAKYGWTDVSWFSALGIPAVNLGPGDPSLAHRADERVPVSQIREVTDLLRGYLPVDPGSGRARAASVCGVSQPDLPPTPDTSTSYAGRSCSAGTIPRRPPTGVCWRVDLATPGGGWIAPSVIRGGCCVSSPSSSPVSDAMSDVAEAVTVFGSAPHQTRYRCLPSVGPSRAGARRGRLRGHHRRRSGCDGGSQPGCLRRGRPIDRPQHRVAVRTAHQSVGRRRHELPLLLRAQDDVRQVRAGLRLPAGRFRHLDELFEALTLVQTKKVERFPIVLVGRDYWAGLIDWMRDRLLAEGMISAGDIDLLHVVDTPEEAVEIVKSSCPTWQGRRRGPAR